MALFDLPLEELRVYCPPRSEPTDFDRFWQQTLAEARQSPLAVSLEPVENHLQTVEAFDVTFPGFGGQPVKGWLLLPRQRPERLPAERPERLPCVVEYIGYGGGRGFPNDWLLWSSAGYAHLVMDVRGQGSGWLKGDTPDYDPQGSSPAYLGFMTRGILSPETYYYRRLITDAVRAVDAARSFPQVDARRVAVTGGSQGGGLALAVGGLCEGLAAVMPNVPFLCHYRRATEVTDRAPYNEIAHFCKIHRDKVESVFHTLSYFDGLNFAARALAPALFSTGLMDMTCPPSTVFAAYNHYAGAKAIRVYPYNDHEGGDNYHIEEQLKFLAEMF